MDTNIKFKIASSFSGEGFTNAEMALKRNRQELAAAKVGLGDVVNAFKEVSPATAEAVSCVQNLTQAFASGNIIAGLVQVGLRGIAWCFEKLIEVHKNAIEYTKKVGEVFDKAFIEILGDANKRVRQHTADMEAMNREADNMMKFLNAGIASELHDKIYRLHMEKLQEVTDDMTAGGKALVEAEYAMKEATLKSKAALDMAANAMKASSEKVANAQKVEEEAKKALAESEYRLAQVNESMSKNAYAVKRATEEHEIAERNLADATRTRENAERESTMAAQKFNAAQQDHILTIKEHEQKIKEANKKLDEEDIARNELKIKEEEAAAKWKEYLDGAFEREMNARNELAMKEEDASLAFNDFIDGLKKSAWGDPEDKDVDSYLAELEGIIDPKKLGKKNEDPRGTPVRVTNPQDIASSFWVNVNNGGGGGGGVNNFGNQQRANRNAGRAQRDAMTELNGNFGNDFQRLIGLVSGVRTQQGDDAAFRRDMVNREIPQLVQQYGLDTVAESMSKAADRLLLPSEYRDAFGNINTMSQIINSTIDSNNSGDQGVDGESAVSVLNRIDSKLDKLGLK